MVSPNGNSYGSVSDPTLATSYQRLENGETTSERASLLVDKRPDDDASSKNGFCKKATRFPPLVKWFLIAVAVACATGAATWAYYRNYNTFREPHESHINPTYRQGPLSLLDPVADLGMYNFDRPLASQPTVHRSLEAPHRGAALPTNAWYQSFLLMDDASTGNDDPTSMHRAYSIPYILDAAGPVAGVRMYPHHVGATSNVIQTYVIENQGLTTGLATADGESALRRYQVELMTPLGITLSWVSVWMCRVTVFCCTAFWEIPSHVRLALSFSSL